ncbi:MAG TPA: RNA-guided endonuclease TnpB family protein [Ktedonobacteraceae bacterium]|nr:RNA-guided endonuclease TnpB family protein [Ktedonobacteraceae bacterium]
MSKRDRPKKDHKLTRTYLFRLYPTRKQMRKLEEWLGLCCEVYNAAPDESKQRRKKRKVVARIHERIANRRKTFVEQEIRHVIQLFGFIAVEALVVRNLLKNPKLAKSIADVSWSMFFTHLLAKAEEAGRQVVRVDPAYTSQTCSSCGCSQPIPLSVRVYECHNCDLVIHRDHNASLNILTYALQAVGRHSRVIPEAPGSQPWGVVTRF